MSLARRLRLSSHVPAVINQFKFPGHMEDYEILSRGSTFPVTHRGKIRWITSRHVTHPHLHADSYYSNDDVAWLKDITSEMTKQTIEWRSPDGGKVLRSTCVKSVRGHPDLDVAELILEEEDLSKEMAFAFYKEIEQVSLENKKKINFDDEEFLFIGHNLNVNIDESTGEDLGNMVPNVESGSSQLSSEFRMVCQTSEILQMGMCGGPVLFHDTENKDVVVGMIEGILPARSEDVGPNDKPKRVADVFPHHCIVMGHDVIAQFLDTLEQG